MFKACNRCFKVREVNALLLGFFGCKLETTEALTMQIYKYRNLTDSAISNSSVHVLKGNDIGVLLDIRRIHLKMMVLRMTHREDK